MGKPAGCYDTPSTRFVWRAGGAIALAAARGERVTIACLTFGERGESAKAWREGRTPAEIKALRREEAERAAAALGAEVRFFDAGDYPLTATPEHAGGILSAYVALWIVEPLGWRAAFWVCVIPLLFVPVLLRYLPESLSFLVAQVRTDRARELAVRYDVELPAAPASAAARWESLACGWPGRTGGGEGPGSADRRSCGWPGRTGGGEGLGSADRRSCGRPRRTSGRARSPAQPAVGYPVGPVDGWAGRPRARPTVGRLIAPGVTATRPSGRRRCCARRRRPRPGVPLEG
ncbi:PIG-L family deacetylase [Streptomyces sp. NPDC058534]|uniref:PIG-L family deacetylase n=1 Tax=Streptomyces sp. NPDC058534 TaxID=3346541 RepID=UPI003657E9AA